jgi:hypothetical protein
MKDHLLTKIMDSANTTVRFEIAKCLLSSARIVAPEMAKMMIETYGYSSTYGIGFAAMTSFMSSEFNIDGIDREKLIKFAPMETLVKSCGWSWWNKDVLAISDRPLKINFDSNGLLHSNDGPAIIYPDGWSIYAKQGESSHADIIYPPPRP